MASLLALQCLRLLVLFMLMHDTTNSEGLLSGPRLPDFIIIGAAKAGTTSLVAYLKRHRDLYLSSPKEPEFFARKHRHRLGLAWYKALFSKARPGQLCGEASTVYSRYPHFREAAGRIASTLPEAKIIYVVREPIARAYSDYVQKVKTARNLARNAHVILPHLTEAELEVHRRVRKADKMLDWPRAGATFEDISKICPWIVDSSLYMLQIEQYLKYLARRQILLIRFEDLVERPADMCKRICQFLDVDGGLDLTASGRISENVAGAHHADFARSMLGSGLHNKWGAPYIRGMLPQRVKDCVYGVLGRTAQGRRVQAHVVPPPMKPDTRRRLSEYYQPSTCALEDFIGQDLSSWISGGRTAEDR